jgi:hypothetical protein
MQIKYYTKNLKTKKYLHMKKMMIYTIGLAVCQLFNGGSGLLGGIMLMRDPSGQFLQMDQAMLSTTPFANFLIPGIVLFIFVGLGNIVGFVLTLLKKGRPGLIGLLFGAVLMIWIVVQVVLIGYQSFLQPLYFLTGLLQAIFGSRLNKAMRLGRTI